MIRSCADNSASDTGRIPKILKGTIMKTENIVTVSETLITEGAASMAHAELAIAGAQGAAETARRAAVQKIIDEARSMSVVEKQFQTIIKRLFEDACEGVRVGMAKAEIIRQRVAAGKKEVKGTKYTAEERACMAAYVIPPKSGVLIPKTASNYRTSAHRAFAGYPTFDKAGKPIRDKQGKIVKCFDYRDGLFTDKRLTIDYNAPKAEPESLEVGEGLAADTKAGKKPKTVQTLTRASVVDQAAALVHALTQVGETDAAEEIRGVLQDYNLWAIPKAVN